MAEIDAAELEAEDAMLALEDAADAPTGWIIDESDAKFFILARGHFWVAWKHRMEVPRRLLEGLFVTTGRRVIRRESELRSIPEPAYSFDGSGYARMAKNG